MGLEPQWPEVMGFQQSQGGRADERVHGGGDCDGDDGGDDPTNAGRDQTMVMVMMVMAVMTMSTIMTTLIMVMEEVMVIAMA